MVVVLAVCYHRLTNKSREYAGLCIVGKVYSGLSFPAFIRGDWYLRKVRGRKLTA